MLVVVYGTLKSGFSNNRVLRDGNAKFVSDCVVRNFKLYHSGFPVASHSEGDCILGEIWDIGDNESTLYRLDSLEGYRKNNPESSMYIRTPVRAFTHDGSYECEMYVGNSPYWNNFKSMREEEKNSEGLYYWGQDTRKVA